MSTGEADEKVLAAAEELLRKRQRSTEETWTVWTLVVSGFAMMVGGVWLLARTPTTASEILLTTQLYTLGQTFAISGSVFLVGGAVVRTISRH